MTYQPFVSPVTVTEEPFDGRRPVAEVRVAVGHHRDEVKRPRTPQSERGAHREYRSERREPVNGPSHWILPIAR